MKRAFKRSLDRSLDAFGYELLRNRVPAQNVSAPGRMQLAPLRRSLAQALEHLKRLGYAPATIIDVGAGHGTDELVTVFPEAFTWWVEPIAEFEPHLQKLRTHLRGEVVMAVAGPEDGEAILHAHEDFYGSSLLRESDGPGADGEERRVRMLRIDTLMAGRDIGEGPLLKVDVQGFELHVLAGALKTLEQCEVVVLETSFFKFHQQSPDFHDVLAFMKRHGFVAYDIVDGHNRPLDNALAQRDVVFVKENGRFRATHEWSSSAQRQRYSGAPPAP